jgi:hypothetical protein
MGIRDFLLKILQEQKDYIVLLTLLIIYFPLFNAYKISFLILFLVGIVDFFNTRLKKKLKQKEKYYVPIFERIFALFPYVLMFFTLISSLTKEAILIFDLESAGFDNLMSIIFIKLIYPGLDGFQSIIGRGTGLENLFSFYFEFYYVGRNKQGFSYFIRYQYVFAMLMSQAFSFTCSMFRIFKGYNIDNFPKLVETFGTTLFICFFILICFGVINTLQGKQPILPFFDLSVQYQIGIREKEDESLIDLKIDLKQDEEE